MPSECFHVSALLSLLLDPNWEKAATVDGSLYHGGSPRLFDGGGLKGWLLHTREDRVALVVARRKLLARAFKTSCV